MVFLRLTVERLYGILGNVAAEVKLTTLALELSLSLSLFHIDFRSPHIPSGEQVKLEIMPIRSVLVEYWRPLLLGKVDFVDKLKWLTNQMFMFVHESITDTEHNNEWFCLQCCWIHSTSVTVCWNCMLLVFHSFTAEKYTPHYDLSGFGRDWLVYSVSLPRKYTVFKLIFTVCEVILIFRVELKNSITLFKTLTTKPT